MSNTIYNVVCPHCGVFQPPVKSPLWYKASQRKFLDALHITPEEHGCVATQVQPQAPFRVLGYDDMCQNFDIPLFTFTEAVSKFLQLQRDSGYTVFIKGVSPAVRDHIQYSY